MSEFRRRLNNLNQDIMGNEFRLIADIAIEEERMMVTIDKDMQDNPLNLKECYVLAKVVGTASSESGTYKQCRIGYNSIYNIPVTAMCNTPIDYSAYLISHAVVLPGVLFRQDEIHRWSFTNSGNNLASNSMYAVDISYDYITSVLVSPGNDCYFGAGSSIRVYGR